MKTSEKILLAFVLLLFFIVGIAGLFPPQTVLAQSGIADPCVSERVAKSSVAINVGSATTTQLVALSSGQSIYACSFTMTAASGTGATYLFESGTGTNCGSNTVALTGAMAGGGLPIIAGSGSTQFKTASGTALCLVTGGTSPSAQGFLNYVQLP